MDSNKLIIIALMIFFIVPISATAVLVDTDTGNFTWNGTTATSGMQTENGGWSLRGGAATRADYFVNVGNDYDGDGFYIINDGGSGSSTEMEYVNTSMNGTAKWYTAMFYDDSADNSVAYSTGPYANLGSIGVLTGTDANNFVYRAAGGWTSLGASFPRGTGWWNLSWYWDESNESIKGYINGTLAFDFAQADQGAEANVGHTNAVFVVSDVNDCANCRFDYFHFWNTTDEVGAPVAGTDYVNITNSSPENNSQFDYLTLNFNITYNSSYTHNVSLYINDSQVNITTGITGGNELYLEFNYTLSEGIYDYWFNVSGGNDSDSTNRNNTFFVDVTDPTLSHNFTTNSVFYKSNVTGQFNFSDNLMLFSINVSVDSFGIFYKEEINSTDYVLNISYNVSTLALGIHWLNVTFADGHTAKTIPNYGWTNGLFNDYIKYEFWDGGWVKIKNKDSSIFDTWTTNKLVDRYTFAYEPNDDKLNSYTFVVTAEEKIHIIHSDNKYKNYLIIGNHWLDFLLDDTDHDVDINRIKDNEVEVTVKGFTPTSKLEFNSIGDLNIVNENFEFTVTNATVSYSSIVNELETQVITLDINITGNITNTSANLNWNGSTKTVTKYMFDNYHRYNASFLTPKLVLTGTSKPVQFTWNYTINTTDWNESGGLTLNQSVFVLGADNCSTYSMRAMNLTLMFESNKSILDGTIAGWFKLWVAEEDNFTLYNLSWHHTAANSPVGICIYPNSSSYIHYSQMEYVDDDEEFQMKKYYFTNHTLDNVTDSVNLFLTNNTVQVKFNVLDPDDDPVEDAIIKVLSYQLETNSYDVTEILKTDENGAAYGEIVQDLQFYQFIIEVDRVVVLSTLPTIITTTEKTFRVDTTTDYLDRYTTVRDITGGVSFTNSTQNFAFTFSDLSGDIQQGCLKIVDSRVNSETTINQTCVTSSGSTIIINSGVGTTRNITSTLIGVGYILFSDGQEFIIDTESVSFDYNYKTYGKSCLFVGFLFVLFLFLVGLWSPVVSIVLGIIGIFALIVMKIIALSWGSVIVLSIMAGVIIYRLNKK